MSEVLGAAEEQLPLFSKVKDCFVSSNTNCFVPFRVVDYQLFRFVSFRRLPIVSFRFFSFRFVSSNTISRFNRQLRTLSSADNSSPYTRA